MMQALTAALLIAAAPPQDAGSTAMLKAVEGCHRLLLDDRPFDLGSFLEGAGYTQTRNGVGDKAWVWSAGGRRLEAWNSMFGCGVTIPPGQGSDRALVEQVRAWTSPRGYRVPRDADTSALLNVRVIAEEGVDLGLTRRENGDRIVSLAPGYMLED